MKNYKKELKKQIGLLTIEADKLSIVDDNGNSLCLVKLTYNANVPQLKMIKYGLEKLIQEPPNIKIAISELKDKILDEYKNGYVLTATPEGLQRTNLEEFLKQPIEGLLYDLNRSEEVVLTFIDDPKWINDYAVCKVIRALKSRIDQLESSLAEYQNFNQ